VHALSLHIYGFGRVIGIGKPVDHGKGVLSRSSDLFVNFLVLFIFFEGLLIGKFVHFLARPFAAAATYTKGGVDQDSVLVGITR
jgi:F0F1-type ATP synthase membrane subunit c/vacuolar-type H+-ATPase subunit K